MAAVRGFGRLWRRGGVGRWTSAVLAIVVAANAVVLLAGFAEAEPALAPAVSDAEVATAAVAIAASAAPEAPEEIDPLSDIAIPAIPVAEPDIVLPVPENPPANPYEATPEVRHGQLSIPAIGLSQPFFEGVSLTAINRGPSHWPGTAMPGEIGNSVIAGHRTTYTRPFWDLQAVQPGDELIFEMADGTRHVYEATGTEVVSPTDIHIVEQTVAKTATLFGCHPRGSARQRIVAHFRLVDGFAQAAADAAATAPS